MNISNVFRDESREIIRHQIFGNILAVTFAIISMTLSMCQITVALCWAPLRKKKQILVLCVPISDVLKSIAYLICDVNRLYLAARHKDEVSTEIRCAVWLAGKRFVTLHSLNAVFALSLERTLAISLPIWYRNHKIGIEIFMVAAGVVAALLGTAASFVEVNENLYDLACTMLSATTPMYYTFLLWYQYIFIAAILMSSLFAAAMLIKRWRKARLVNADMIAFKKANELQMLKPVFVVVILCLASFFGGTCFMASLERADQTTKAKDGPFLDCFNLVRGLFEFAAYLIFVKEYKIGLFAMFCKKSNQVTPESSPQQQQQPKTNHAVETL